jgi:hypothetical protein
MSLFCIRQGSRILVGLALLASLAAAGCGSSRKSSISGEVKYNGQPLPSGTVTFLGQDGEKKVAGADIVDGKYKIASFPRGVVKVTVVTLPPSQGGSPPNGQAIPTPGGARVGAYMAIPKRYAVPEQSPLSYTVSSGDQTYNIDLTP